MCAKRSTATPAGYSGTPLIKKLGIKPGFRICAIHAPEEYWTLLGPLPPQVESVDAAASGLDFVHLFTAARGELEEQLPVLRNTIAQNGMIWVSWPKRASRVPTDVTEDVVREVALPLGLVDTKVAAVDAVWSALRLVIRKELRSG